MCNLAPDGICRFDITVEVPLSGAKALPRMLRDGLRGKVSKEDLVCLARAAGGQSATDVDGAFSPTEIARDMGVSRGTVYKAKALI